jgi:hypothetical protein
MAGDGVVSNRTLPRLSMDWKAPHDRNRPSSLPFQARIVQLVRSAVRFVFAPDILFHDLPDSDEVKCPMY